MTVLEELIVWTDTDLAPGVINNYRRSAKIDLMIKYLIDNFTFIREGDTVIIENR